MTWLTGLLYQYHLKVARYSDQVVKQTCFNYTEHGMQLRFSVQTKIPGQHSVSREDWVRLRQVRAGTER